VKRLLALYDTVRYDPTLDEGANRYHDEATLLVQAMFDQSGDPAIYRRKAGYVMSWPAALLTAEAPIAEPPEPVAPASYADVVADDEPFVWWRMEETSGSTVADQIGSNNGTVTGADLDVAGPSGTGSAVSFDGTDDRIDVGTLGSYGSSIAAGFTVECWVKFTGTSFAIAAGTVNDGSSFLMQLMVNANRGGTVSAGRIAFSLRLTSGQSANVESSGTSYNDGEWHHVGVKWSSGTAPDLWIDGVRDVGSDRSETGSTANFGYPLFLGARNLRGTADQFYAGDMDEFALYDKRLADARFTAHYNAGVA